MVASRRSRLLGVSAVILVLIFIFVQTHSNQSSIGTSGGSPAGGANNDLATQHAQHAAVDKLAGGGAGQQPQQPQQDGSSSNEAAFDAKIEFNEIMTLSPVVLFSKTYCGYSKALKNLLQAEYEVSPGITVVELDKHKNGRLLQDYLAEISGRKTVPNLFINGISRGGSDEMKQLHLDGKLLSNLVSWGGKKVKFSKKNAPSNS